MTARAPKAGQLAPDWPYDDADPPEETIPAPTWVCPEKICDCHPAAPPGDPVEFVVLLCDDRANAMPGARYRLIHDGEVINDETPNADAQGFIQGKVRSAPTTVVLEWAPRDTPDKPYLPYRALYYVEIENVPEQRANQRRMHNLGFLRFALMEDNVRDFQAAFDYPVLTGDMKDIEDDLKTFHDDNGIPPIDDEEEEASRPRLGFTDAGPNQGSLSGVKQKKTKKGAQGRQAPPVSNPASGSGSGTARLPPVGFIEVAVASMFAQPLMGSSTITRWSPLHSHFVDGATFELFDNSNTGVAVFAAANASKNTDARGRAKLDLRNLPDGTYVLRLNPPPGHELRGLTPGPLSGAARSNALLPVGPNDQFLNDIASATRFRFVEVTIDLQGSVVKEAVLVNDMWKASQALVAHCSAFLEPGGSLLWIDWKPDWVCIPHAVKLPTKAPNGAPLSKTQFVILHETTRGTPGSTLNLFTRPKENGAHYLIDVAGHVIKMAPELSLVKHTGPVTWFDLISTHPPSPASTITSFNALCIGIEQVHAGHGSQGSFPLVQVAATKGLVERLKATFHISPHNVLGHNEVKTTGDRENCPGFQLEWSLLENSGNATKPGSGTIPPTRYGGIFSDPNATIHPTSPVNVIRDLQSTLRSLGYQTSIGVPFAKSEQWLKAFQNRYFAGQFNGNERAGFTRGARRVADLTTVQRMHDVLAARGGFTY